ncbi:MAG TPA: hypothetical protein VGJ74_04795 [Burkholderiales bacterium]
MNYKSLLRHRNLRVAPDRRMRKRKQKTVEYFSMCNWKSPRARKAGFSSVREVMPIALPARAAPGARPDVGLLDAPSVHIDLGERAAIAILAEGTQRDFAGSDEHLQSTLRCPSARLVQLGGVDVRETHFLVIAHERIAVDRDAALAAERGGA